jgi:hypothetical protein
VPGALDGGRSKKVAAVLFSISTGLSSCIISRGGAGVWGIILVFRPGSSKGDGHMKKCVKKLRK